MIKFLRNISLDRWLLIILLLGFILRIAFLLFGAEIYFNRESIYYDGDTLAWLGGFKNLLDTGSYFIQKSSEYGFAGRIWGYSFFLGFFYFLTGGNLDIMFPLVAITQILLDCLVISFVYSILLSLFNSKQTGLIGAFLYATYPFIIVWTPVAYSETISIFSLITSLYFIVCFKGNLKYFWGGVFLSFGVLNRPQILLILPIIALVPLYYFWITKQLDYIIQFALFSIAVLIVYGSWPIRNMVFHDKLEFTQDLRGLGHWDEDIISFMQFTYAVKSGWEPQFTNLIKGEEVSYPSKAYMSKKDSLALEKAIHLSQTCSHTFSKWEGYWKEKVIKDQDTCQDKIDSIFSNLRQKYIQKHPLDFYLWVPLQNLKKVFFKSKLYNTQSFSRQLASKLFLYRTILLFIGLAGVAFWLLFYSNKEWGGIILIYSVGLYLLLCFGTQEQMRNIEMRYFLPVDILLLLPASLFFFIILRKTGFIQD